LKKIHLIKGFRIVKWLAMTPQNIEMGDHFNVLWRVFLLDTMFLGDLYSF